ncbi:MAG: OmpA family protein [Vibrio sp.]
MNKKWITLLFAPVLLLGCAQEPNPTTTRHQIDDLADEDRDGVINQRDLCSDTPSGVAVDRQGCTHWQIQEVPNVVSFFFDYDRYNEKPEHHVELDKLVALLQANPETQVTLVGDTSAEGTNAYNKVLAQHRTHTIRSLLIARGIAAERIHEQEFTQITSLTEQLKARKRRTIAVVMTREMSVKPTWNIFSSEQQLQPKSKVEVNHDL